MKSIKKLNIVELFGGIGAIQKALIKTEIPHKVIDYVEIDKNCVKSYNALYNKKYEPKSVINYTLPNEKIDILMHGSPCQDFSRAGLKRGGEKGSGTRSSLLFETIRIIKDATYKPKWVIWENVKGVLDKNMKNSFFNYLKEMEHLGYENTYEILNAMDFGIPQKRERIFVISYLGKNQFSFKNLKQEKTRHIKEFLEQNTSEFFEVKQKSMLKFLEEEPHKPNFKGKLKIIDDFAYTILIKQMRVPNSGIVDIGNNKYRYLTERECLRLMGFEDTDVDILEKIHPRRKNCINGILYKQAGNSIVVNILESILMEIKRLEK